MSRNSTTARQLSCRDLHGTLKAKAQTISCPYSFKLASGGFYGHSSFMYEDPGSRANAPNQKSVEI